MSCSNYPKVKLLYHLSRDDTAEGISKCNNNGFTMVEILIVIVVIAIAAFTAIPMISSAGSVQIRSASNMIIGDIEYAKSISITRSQPYSVVFEPTNEKYSLEDQSGTVIAHPVRAQFDYVVDFKNDGRLSKVNIVSTTFSGNKITFDSLGSPDNGGTIIIEAGGDSVKIKVEPVTGYVRVE
jgi:prepilin-type N-terminal cleavage/methylation domain-containing protein